MLLSWDLHLEGTETKTQHLHLFRKLDESIIAMQVLSKDTGRDKAETACRKHMALDS